MRKIFFVGVWLLLVVIGLTLVNQGAAAQGGGPTPTPRIIPRSGTQDASGSRSPTSLTSFVINNPYCYQPDPAVDQCMINFRYISATDNQSSAPYMTWLAITISSKARYRATAFFEGSIYYYYSMNPNGFKVACGAPNAGGWGTAYGNAYGVTVQPLDSSGNPMSTDIANVVCPAFAP